MKMSYVKKTIFTAACIALSVVLPMTFHAIPNAGSVLSPMHIPVLLCGLVCGSSFGLLCGLAGPLLSGLITGMPVFAYLPGMMIELAIYGLVCGLMMQLIHTGRIYADLYISLIISLLAGRIIAGIANALIFASGQYSIAMWTTSYFVTAWPGLLLHLALVPSIVLALERAGFIPARYPDASTL